MRAGTLAIAVLFACGCSKEEPTGHDHANANEVLYFADGLEATGHIPLTGGGTNRLEFSLLDANGHVITETDHFQLTLTWDPADLAIAVPVAGTTTQFDVSTTKPADTDGLLTLSVYHPHDQTTKTMLPMHILVH